MGTKQQSKGKCVHCGFESTKAGITKHLLKCLKINETLEKNDSLKNGTEIFYNIRVEDSFNKNYWLNLEIAGSASLKKLDDYLRAIWLECCGHLSEFSIGGWTGRKINMKNKVDEIFEQGLELIHIYDFGSSSETKIKVSSSRIGNGISSHPVTLLARNTEPEYECIECGVKSSWLCMECLIEENIWGTFCDVHIKKHPHKGYGEPVPLVNSPRAGVCCYIGPADPPY